MHVIKLRRKLWLYRQIHKLNQLDVSILGKDWDRDLISTNNLGYYDINDIWLKFLCQPEKFFTRILRLSVLFLISSDKTILISGKKIQYLEYVFSGYELKQLKQLKLNKDLLIPDISIPIEFFTTTNALEQLALALLNRVYSNNKHTLLVKRYRLRFDYNLDIEHCFSSYVHSFNEDTLEQVILMALKIIMPNLLVTP